MIMILIFIMNYDFCFISNLKNKHDRIINGHKIFFFYYLINNIVYLNGNIKKITLLINYNIILHNKKKSSFIHMYLLIMTFILRIR